MEQTGKTTYKRKDRSVSPETAQKISNSLKSYNATHPRSEQWRKKISDRLRADTGGYWSKIPKNKECEEEETTIYDIML